MEFLILYYFSQSFVSKQWIPLSDAAYRGVRSGPVLSAYVSQIYLFYLYIVLRG